MPGRIALGIDNFEVGAFVFEGAVYLGDFTNGVLPQSFGGYLKIDSTPNANPDRAVLADASELSDDEVAALNTDRDSFRVKLEDFSLVVNGSYTPAASTSPDAIDRFSILKLDAAIDLGLRAKLGPVELYGFNGNVSLAISEDRSDDLFNPSASFSFDSVGVDYVRFRLLDYFDFTAEDTTFYFTDTSKPLLRVEQMSLGSLRLGLSGTANGFELNRRGIPQLDQLDSIDVTFGGDSSVLGEVLGFFPIVVDGLGFSLKDTFYARNDKGEITGIANPSQFLLRISGGMQSPKNWPAVIRWPFTAKVTDLEVDVAKVLDPTLGFPITNLTEIELGMEMTEIGPVKIGGNLVLGILREDPQPGKSIGDIIFARINTVTGKIERTIETTPGAIPLIYGRVKGVFSGFDISGGIDLVLSPLGPTQAKLIIPTSIPLGTTPLLLSEVSGGINFGVTALRNVEHASELVNDPIFLDPFEVDTAGIRASILAALDKGTPTLLEAFTVGLSGTVTTTMPGILTGEASFVVNVDTGEFGLDTSNPNPTINTGVRFLGTGLLSSFGIPIGRAGILIDQSDLFSPELAIAFSVPSPDSPLGFLFNNRADLSAKLEVGGANLVALVALTEFLTNVVEETEGLAFDRLAAALNDAPNKPLAVLLAGPDASDDFEFTAEFLQMRLMSGEDALLPTPQGLQSLLSNVDTNKLSERSQSLGKLFTAFIQEIPSLFFEVDTLRQAARGDIDAVEMLAREGVARLGELTQILVTSLLEGGIAAGDSFNPSLLIEGKIQPMFFGFPTSSGVGGSIRLDKTGLRVVLEASILDAIKTFMPQLAPAIHLSPIGPLADQVTIDASLRFPDPTESDPTEFLELLLDSFESTKPEERIRLVLTELPVGLDPELLSNVIVVLPTLPADYDPINHPERYPYTIVTDVSQIAESVVQFTRIDDFVEAMQIGTAAPYSLELVDYLIDIANPLADHWQLALIGTLSGYGFENLVEFAGLAFGPQYDDGEYHIRDVVKDRLRLVVDELPTDLPDALLPLVILVAETFPADYDPENHPERYAYTIVIDEADIDGRFVKLQRVDRFEHVVRFGGFVAAGDLRLPRVLSNPFEVYEEIDGDRWPDGRSGFLPPLLPVVTQQRLEDELFEVIGEVGAFATDSLAYAERLRNTLTTMEQFSRIEFFLPSPAGFLDLDNDRVTSLDPDANPFDAYAQAFDDAAVTELFAAGYLTGWSDLDLLGINWGSARYDASLQGVRIEASLPILYGLELEILGGTREVSLLEMASDLLDSPLSQAFFDSLDATLRDGLNVVDLVLNTFGIDSLDAVQTAYRAGDDLIHLLPESMQSRLSQQQLRDAADYLTSLITLLDIRVQVPIAAGQLELTSENIFDFAIEVNDSDVNRLATSVSDVGRALAVKLFGENFFTSSFTPDVVIPPDLAAIRVAAFTPLASEPISGQPNTVEQNGGLRFGMDLNIPGLFERSSATFEVQATEALADLDITDLMRIPNFKATVATEKLALPNLFQKVHPDANELISLNDFAIRLERNSAGVFADLDGTLNILDREAIRAFGRLELRDAGGVVGVLKVELNADESLSLGGVTLTGSFFLHINNTMEEAQFEYVGSTITIRPGTGLFVDGSLAVNGVTISSGKFSLQSNGRTGLSIEAFGQVNFLGRMRTVRGSFSIVKSPSGSLVATGFLSDVSDNRDLPMKGPWVVRESAVSLTFSIGSGQVPTFEFEVSGKIQFAKLSQTLDVTGWVSSTGEVSLSVSDLPAFSFGLGSHQFTLDLPGFTITADPAATSLSASVSSASATVPGLGTFTLPAMSFESDGSFSVTLAQQASFGIFKTSGRLVLRSLGSGSGIELAVLDSTNGTAPRIVIDPIVVGQDNLLDITMNEFAIRSSGSIVAIDGGNATGTLNRLGQANVLEITDASVQFRLHDTQGFYVSLSGARLRMFGGSPHAIGDISFSSAGLGHAGTSLGTDVSTLFNLTSFGLTKAFEKLGELPGLAIERLKSVQSALGVNLRLGDNGLEFAQANNDSRSFNLFELNVTMKKLLVASNGVLQFDLVGDLDAFGIFRIEGADRMEFRRDESGAAQLLIARRMISSFGVITPVPYSLTICHPLAPSNRVVDITMFSDLLWRSNGSVTTPTGGTALGEGRIGNDWLRLNANFALLSSGTTLRLEMSSVSLRLPFGAEKPVPKIVRLCLNGGFISQPNLTTIGSGAFQSLFRINLGNLVNNAVAGFNAGNGLFDLNLSRDNGLTLALRPNETIPLTIFGSGLTINSFTASTSGNFAADVTGSLTLQSHFDEFSRFPLAEASFKLERRANGPLQLWLNPSPATREYTLPFGGRLDLSGFVSTSGEFSLGGQLSLGSINYRSPETGNFVRRSLPSVTVYLTHQGMFVEGDFFGNGVIVSGRLLPSGTALLQVGNTIIPVVLPGGTSPPFLSETAQGIGGMWRAGLQAGKEILDQGLEELERRGAEVEKGLKDAAAAVQAGIEQGLDALNQLAEKGAKTLGNTFKIVLNVFNGPVDQGLVFLDTNGNNTFDFLDENGNDVIDIGEWFEPFAILVNGSAVLFVAEPFDINGNGQIDPEEGTLIATSGTNLITGLPLASPMLGRIDGTITTVSPLSTLVTALAETYAIELNDAQSIVRDQLGLPEIDLLALNPWTATAAGNRDAADVLASHIAVANTFAQVVAFIGGRHEVSDFELHQVAYYSLAESLFSNEAATFDLTSEIAVDYLLKQAFARLGILEDEEIIADAATVIVNSNRLVLTIPRDASREYVESVARVEVVVQGEVADALWESANEGTDTGAWQEQFSDVSLAELVNDARIGRLFTDPRLLDVEIGNGKTNRSFVRDIDLLFSDMLVVEQLLQPGRVQVMRRDLNGENPTLLTDTNLSADGNELRLNFGTQGLGGNRNSNAGDGYYQIGIDMDGDGEFDVYHHFHRLLGDINGDGVVDLSDRNAVMAAMRTQDLNGDVNGDGIVNSADFSLVSRAIRRKLKDGLWVDE